MSPHPVPELEALRNDTVRALEIADEQAEIRAMSRGDLEAQARAGDRAQATAPPDISSQLRLTAQAKADAWQQSADAEAEHDQVRAENARSLATVLAVHTRHLEAADARFEEWSARTASSREIAGTAIAELQRRGQHPPARRTSGPQSMAAWWRELHADADAVDRAIEREHQAAVYDSQPWPPEPKPEAGYEEPDACPPGREPQPGPGIPGSRTEPEPEASKPGGTQPEAAGPVPADDGRATRLDERRTARTRPRAGSTRSAQSSTPAASTPRGQSASPRPDLQPASRRRRPMTWKWSCERPGTLNLAAYTEVMMSAN